MAERQQLSAKTRFDVFKRDGFICQYCGSHPPQVKLHVDHIVAVVAGGKNDTDNLVTSCERCNLGKGPRDLKAVPQGLADKASDIAEREAQLKGYYEIIEAKRDRIEQEAWDVVFLFEPDAKSFDRDWLISIKKFIERLGYHETLDSMEYALARKPYGGRVARFKYFCGVCWGKLKDREGQR